MLVLNLFAKGQKKGGSFFTTPNVKIHWHTIIKTIQQIKSKTKGEKEDEYSNSLATIQVFAMFRAGDIRRNVFLKVIKAMYGDAMLISLRGTNMAAGS